MNPVIFPLDRPNSHAGGAIRDPWLYRLAPRQLPTARLFCFPYAGVGPSVFRHWPAGLPGALEVWAVQLPGRGSRINEPAIANIPTLAAAILEAIKPYLDMPFALFGHSMGAILAFEVAQGLASKGFSLPNHLVVSGRRPPHIPNPESPLHGLSDADFVFEINQRYGGIPPEILENPDILALVLPGLRADITALETHRPARHLPLSCPISAFGGKDDPLTSPLHLEAWRSETTDRFEVCHFPGGHFYLDGQRVSVLARLVATLSTMLNPASRSQREHFV
jgi:medium-chain acyl-[acyl-carrier-protein] hydrolase